MRIGWARVAVNTRVNWSFHKNLQGTEASKRVPVHLSRDLPLSTTLFSTVACSERWKCVRWFHKCHLWRACAEEKEKEGKYEKTYAFLDVKCMRAVFLRDRPLFVDLNGVHVLRVPSRSRSCLFRTGHPWSCTDETRKRNAIYLAYLYYYAPLDRIAVRWRSKNSQRFVRGKIEGKKKNNQHDGISTCARKRVKFSQTDSQTPYIISRGRESWIAIDRCGPASIDDLTQSKTDQGSKLIRGS